MCDPGARMSGAGYTTTRSGNSMENSIAMLMIKRTTQPMLPTELVCGSDPPACLPRQSLVAVMVTSSMYMSTPTGAPDTLTFATVSVPVMVGVNEPVTSTQSEDAAV